MTDIQFQDRFIAARRQVIAHDFSHLNPMQQEAVMATEGPLLLLAGAGSGKTTVLINRIANLLKYGRGADAPDMPEHANEEDLALLEAAAKDPTHPQMAMAQQIAALDPCEPWRILAITFTNKAADELKNRLEHMLGPQSADVWAQTFHSACVRILRKHIDLLGYTSNFTIYDTGDSNSIMKRILKEMDLDEKTFPHRAVLGQISKAKDALISPEEYLTSMQSSGDIRKIRTAEAYVTYARRLRDANALDFDDLIYYTVRLLQEYPDVREYYQRRFRYVLIDEYQDTNNLQYLLSSLLAGGYENICVVGDDDQSIYKFRGATIENILNFEQQYGHARTIRLEQNYRSSGHILAASNAVIANNRGRKGKTLWTNQEMGDKLCLYIAQNEYDEAEHVASTILEQYTNGSPWRDNAILYRMNAQSNQIEFAFKRSGIPYRIIGGTRFFDRAEIKDMLSYLTVLLTPADDLRLTRIINTPVRGIGLRTIGQVSELAQQNECAMFDVLLHADHYPELQRSGLRLRQFAHMIEELRSLAQTTPLDQLYDILLEKTGYIRALEEKATDENTTRIENVRELKTNIMNYMKDSGDTSLAGFLDEIALYTDIEQYDKDADCVILMTMHAAKGLEFPRVFLVGAEEGIFPSTRSIGDPSEMEEERRLCYVALTRAKKNLHICCARQRMLFGRTSANRPSRFVSEIPNEYMDTMGAVSSFGGKGQGFASGSNSSSTGTSEQGGSYAVSGSKHALAPPAASPSAAYAVGDKVVHRAFGAGCIQSMKPMGGDYFIEIAFESSGMKKMMLRTAAQHMEKA